MIKRKISLVFFLCICCLSSMAFSLTYNHLRSLDLLAQNRKNKIPEVPENFKVPLDDIWGVTNLEDLVFTVYRLKQERDEAMHLLSCLASIAEEKDPVNKKVFFSRYPDSFFDVQSAGCDQLVYKYDSLFRQLSEMLGVRDMHEIAMAMLQLKQEWKEARDKES